MHDTQSRACYNKKDCYFIAYFDKLSMTKLLGYGKIEEKRLLL